MRTFWRWPVLDMAVMAFRERWYTWMVRLRMGGMKLGIWVVDRDVQARDRGQRGPRYGLFGSCSGSPLVITSRLLGHVKWYGDLPRQESIVDFVHPPSSTRSNHEHAIVTSVPNHHPSTSHLEKTYGNPNLFRHFESRHVKLKLRSPLFHLLSLSSVLFCLDFGEPISSHRALYCTGTSAVAVASTTLSLDRVCPARLRRG